MNEDLDDKIDDRNSQEKVDYDPTKIDVKSMQIKDLPFSVFNFLKKLISIDEEVSPKKTISAIISEIDFKGSSIWILICSIVVASIGLNNNSNAVIIGAMLISPLMGPIRGIGLSLATNNFKILIRSLINFGVMVGVSLLASYIFFLITPLKAETSELLLRTKPYVFDILIAFFGGLAGIIAAATSSKNAGLTVIPGVAIATALMPPLCTVGYGMAVGNWDYFAGAFYLFSLNSVFICLSTFLIIRLLKFPKVEFINPKTERKVKFYVVFILLLIVIPSILKFSDIIKESIFNQNANEFVEKTILVDNQLELVKKEFLFFDDSSLITLHVGGFYVDEPTKKQWKNQLQNYDLSSVKLKVVNLSSKELDEAALLNKLLENNNQKFNSISEERDLYKNKLQKIAQLSQNMDDLNNRINTHFPSLNHFAFGETYEYNGIDKDTIFTFFFNWDSTVLFIDLEHQNELLDVFINKELQLLNSEDSLDVRLIKY
ncbi:MAG: DUF389 domain-containing protein [Flavobacteriales bacterium]|jgi:uncharacterized hydrophobic protein (TIGR00271 family)|nr:DUF389 domain-containing protein [Flavobacteriales bacterium]